MPTLLTEPLGTTGPGTEEQPLTAALLTEPPGTEEQPLTATPATEPPGTAAPLAAAPGTKLSSAEEPLAGALSTVPPDAAAPARRRPSRQRPAWRHPPSRTPARRHPPPQTPARRCPPSQTPARRRPAHATPSDRGASARAGRGGRRRLARRAAPCRADARVDAAADAGAGHLRGAERDDDAARADRAEPAAGAAAARPVGRRGVGGVRGGGRAAGRGGRRARGPEPGAADAGVHRPVVERHRQRGRRGSRARPEVESALLPLRARISVRAGLGNLATGLRPPATGHDNPHYFDDAACVRACVLAVAHPGDPRLAAELAEFDARYTQDGDGVHGARAMAAAVSLALAGADVDACVNAALAELPASTEIGRNTRHALRLARESEGTFALVPLLEHQIVDHVYSYGIAAAETVPVALALATAAQGRIAEAVPAAACLSRVADSAPALAGALTGALGGGATIPAAWRDACRTLSGCALPRLTGTDLIGLADLLEATELATPEG